MRLPRVRFTIRWFMIRLAVLAAAIAFLVSADREGRTSRCGYPHTSATMLLLVLSLGYGLVRIVIWGIRHPS
jgi:hypothetical protein